MRFFLLSLMWIVGIGCLLYAGCLLAQIRSETKGSGEPS